MKASPQYGATWSRNARREGARGDMRRGTDWRAGTGDNVPPRIAGAHDKAELFGAGDKARHGPRREPDDHQRAVRRRAETARARRLRDVDQSLQRGRIGMAEGETDAAGERPIAQPMHADGGVLASLVPTKASTHARIPAFAGMSGISRSAIAERNGSTPSVATISRARSLGPRFASTCSSRVAALTASVRRHNADETRACIIAADGDT